MILKKRIIILFLCLPLFGSSQLFKKDATTTRGQKQSKVKKVLIPTVTYKSSFKFTLGFMASGFYGLSKVGTISPQSSSSLIGGYSTNGT